MRKFSIFNRAGDGILSAAHGSGFWEQPLQRSQLFCLPGITLYVDYHVGQTEKKKPKEKQFNTYDEPTFTKFPNSPSRSFQPPQHFAVSPATVTARQNQALLRSVTGE